MTPLPRRTIGDAVDHLLRMVRASIEGNDPDQGRALLSTVSDDELIGICTAIGDAQRDEADVRASLKRRLDEVQVVRAVLLRIVERLRDGEDPAHCATLLDQVVRASLREADGAATAAASG